jgi:hypothetical protein
MTKKEQKLIAYGTVLGLSLGLLYFCIPDAEIHVLRAASRLCQKTAYHVGSWGIRSERYYHTIIEKNRM